VNLILLICESYTAYMSNW